MYDVAPLAAKLRAYVGPRSLAASLVVSFASLASLLAVLGIYAVERLDWAISGYGGE